MKPQNQRTLSPDNANTKIKPGLLSLGLIRIKRIEEEAMKSIETHNKMFEDHSKLLYKHDSILNSAITQSIFDTKLALVRFLPFTYS